VAAYLLGAINVNDHDGYEKYRRQTGPLLMAMEGAEILSADDAPDILEGTQPANHLFIVRFETMELLQEFYHSDAYSSMKCHRIASGDTRYIMAMRGLCVS
jgi:uncharacterized protein (DUF1330 family)